MFGLIGKFIGINRQENESGPQSQAMQGKIAACSLLLEAAHVDNECTDDELFHVIETIKAKFGVSQDYAEQLKEIAHKEREQAIDLWQFTNHINQTCSHDEKILLMEDVWRIIHADGQLEKHEDHFAHKLANLLRLSHKEMINAKMTAKNEAPPA